MRNAVDLAFVDGFRYITLAGAALALGSAVAALLLIRSDPRPARR
jgi:hypothetical protein